MVHVSSSESATSTGTARAVERTLLDRVLASPVGERDDSRDPAAAGGLEALPSAEDDPAAVLVHWFGGVPDLADPAERARVKALLARDVARLEAMVARQVNAILHHPAFQRFEASWRGLWYLCEKLARERHALEDRGETGRIRVKLFNVSKRELLDDLEGAIEFDQSQLFQKVYEEEFGTPGGEPYGVLIGDYPFTSHPRDVALLQQISGVAAAAFAPFVASASPELLDLDSFSQLSQPIDLARVFDQRKYTSWHTLRNQEDSRFVALTLPWMLMRRPHRDDGGHDFVVEPGSPRRLGFRFEEEIRGQSDYLWGSAAYALAGVLIRAYARYGWFANVRGLPADLAGGRVDDATFVEYDANPRNLIPKPIVSVVVDTVRDNELADLGFIPLCQSKDDATAAFFSLPTLNRPKQYTTAEATASARLSAPLQYTMCVSRFAHYLKVMARDMTGSGLSAGDVQRRLRTWIAGYVAEGFLDAEMKAKKPLREADVRVEALPQEPGHYQVTMLLRPHFQLEQIVADVQLVSRVTPVGSASGE